MPKVVLLKLFFPSFFCLLLLIGVRVINRLRYRLPHFILLICIISSFIPRSLKIFNIFVVLIYKVNMKRLLLFLLIGIALSACRTVHDTVRLLELGMEKQSVLLKIGNSYAIESVSDTPDGRVEVLRYPTDNYPAYLLVFFNDKLIEINRDHQPLIPQQNVNITKEGESK